jgi:hypothetical protein
MNDTTKAIGGALSIVQLLQAGLGLINDISAKGGAEGSPCTAGCGDRCAGAEDRSIAPRDFCVTLPSQTVPQGHMPTAAPRLSH